VGKERRRGVGEGEQRRESIAGRGRAGRAARKDKRKDSRYRK
jgi:hypothetical protein